MAEQPSRTIHDSNRERRVAGVTCISTLAEKHACRDTLTLHARLLIPATLCMHAMLA
jgi:hypothetical protein